MVWMSTEDPLHAAYKCLLSEVITLNIAPNSDEVHDKISASCFGNLSNLSNSYDLHTSNYRDPLH